ncbi:DedA family protein [Allopusillimonas ginsengisoli]|uniref:DedA family protein n=1 Tax=Allopusillimonas ginsengisoli TaxID=453575 RepID=UPI0010223A09|nr:DedA family protein [Allopusillimonas ginsengisoli]TEA78053.1 DedA family protein [Allopusillimonas ginsengisoli]
MNQYLDPLLAFVEANHDYAGPVLALLTLGESLLVIGIIIPASVVMLVMGGLIGSGMVEAAPVLLWGIAGAIVGDAISYFIGRWLGPTLLHTWPLNRQRRAVARARLLFMRHGSLAVFAGRFLGPLRSITPTLAGMMKMRQSRFLLANVASAIAWLPLMLLPGYLTGRGMQSVDDSHFGIVLAGVLSIVLAVWVARAMIRRRRQSQEP